MSEDLHRKAQVLLAARRVEGLGEADRRWLDKHLEECAPCKEHAESLERAVSALRAFSVPLDAAVVEATRRRVRARARELRERREHARGLWIACTLSWILGAASAPLLWVGFRWLGEHLGVPQALWMAALGVYWILPAALGAALLARSWQRTGEEDELVSRARR